MADNDRSPQQLAGFLKLNFLWQQLLQSLLASEAVPSPRAKQAARLTGRANCGAEFHHRLIEVPGTVSRQQPLCSRPESTLYRRTFWIPCYSKKTRQDTADVAIKNGVGL